MQIHKCKNNVTILYEPIQESSFCGIELWFSFGVADDPIGENGIIHLLEHLMGKVVEYIDVYADHALSASTSKDRIRIGTVIGKRHVEEVLGKWIQALFSFKVTEDMFEYQKEKVMQEILYVKKAPILEAICHLEESFMGKYNYDRPIFGVLEDVEKITLRRVQNFFQSICGSGLCISIVGECDIDRIKYSIENYIKFQDEDKNNIPMPIEQGQKDIAASFSGTLYAYDIGSINDRLVHWCVLHDFRLATRDIPARAKVVYYLKQRVIYIYIPDETRYYDRFEKWRAELKTDIQARQIKDYLYDELQEIKFSVQRYSLFLQENNFYGYDNDLDNYLSQVCNLDVAKINNFHYLVLQCPLSTIKMTHI